MAGVDGGGAARTALLARRRWLVQSRAADAAAMGDLLQLAVVVLQWHGTVAVKGGRRCAGGGGGLWFDGEEELELAWMGWRRAAGRAWMRWG